ncbi:Uncharacterized protein OS=Candidatus Methanoperedens nitroreducens GN=ANME2D_02467 PE=4 SV=1 [Gemmata massiliana]|uniref:DNA methylase n=1 Tax=Gemmata massiliana TaxID=1210884 RepID=A0A6P2D0H1_9BACT|nr:DNA methylase [Gemmata massiliana]VTR94868.1 Uncharacterized protein OS=Candidatus Methanoperedens nitroreducens GN=ANME2D_02467 PE=4 SV=1 [Gemmata massiliana]
MAESPSHKWGQIIGQEFLEVAIAPLLRDSAKKHRLFLDMKGPRPARAGKKITWEDLYGNAHDLDFVFERGGTPERIGDPVAFIETAWRRYTKHSRNKAQEIQGAVLPLVTTHQRHAPFIGVIVAGEWTEGARTQLQSLGFRVLYFSYNAIVAAFGTIGINAAFGEDTPDAECKKKIAAWEALPPADRTKLAENLLATHANDVKVFADALERAVTRHIEVIRVLPLHGIAAEAPTIEGAIETIERYNESAPVAKPVARYEIQIRYNNGDTVGATYSSKEDAVASLLSFLPLVPPFTTAAPTDAE